MYQDLTDIAISTIPEAGNNKKVMYRSNSTDDIIDVILYADKRSAAFTSEFSKHITGTTIKQQCRAIYDFIQTNIRYKEDKNGVQYIKSPAQLFYDGEGDCKSYSLFIGSVLKNLDIRFVYRFVSFEDNEPFSHVYVVAFDENENEIYLDAVPPMHFNEQHPEIITYSDYEPFAPKIGKIHRRSNNSERRNGTFVTVAFIGLLVLILK